jgi:2-dehydropantoate 2-reductase
MKILVVGAGVIGTVYATRLQNSGHSVTVLARGDRLEHVQRFGLEIEDLLTGTRAVAHPAVTARLAPNDAFDLVLVAVRLDQLDEILPELTAYLGCPSVLFLLNNPSGSGRVLSALGGGRGLLGFPGVGGSRDGGLVRYALIAQQPTMLGELDGRSSERVRQLQVALRGAGFPTRVSSEMEAWLMGHGFFIAAVCGAIYRAGGTCSGLSRDTDSLTVMTMGVREGFAAVRTLGLPVTPLSLRVLFIWLPRSFAISYWRRFFATSTAEFVFGRHARSAPGEVRAVATECRALLSRSGLPSPALDRLFEATDHYQPKPSRPTG